MLRGIDASVRRDGGKSSGIVVRGLGRLTAECALDAKIAREEGKQRVNP